jgi:hypothetical protein
MKITVTVDCSPEEARACMGLPDVRPMQEALMKDLQQHLSANMQTMNPEAVMKTWLAPWFPGADELQKGFWSQLQRAMSGATASAGGTTTGSGERKGG